MNVFMKFGYVIVVQRRPGKRPTLRHADLIEIEPDSNLLGVRYHDDDSRICDAWRSTVFPVSETDNIFTAWRAACNLHRDEMLAEAEWARTAPIPEPENT